MPRAKADPTITRRHVDILTAMADGLSNKAIALRLRLSPKTVDVHRQNIFKLLDIHTAGGVVGWAFRAGVIK